MDQVGASLLEAVDEGAVVTDARLVIVAWNGAMQRLSGIARADALGRPAVPVLTALGLVGVADHLARALAGESTRTGEVRRESGDPPRSSWIEARYAPWRDADGRIAGVVGFHTDVTERRRDAVFVRALAAIGHSLTSSLDLQHVLDTIVGKALEVMGADSALVVSWDGRAPEFSVMRAAGRLSSEYAAKGVIPAGGGPISRAVLQGAVAHTPDILTDPATWLEEGRRRQIEREGFHAVAAAPLRSQGRVHGALVVHYWTVRSFAEEDLAPLRLLAEQAALAIDNARVYADATRRAERLRELAELEQVVMESLVVDDVLRRIAQAAARLLGAPVVQLWTADPVARVLRLQASAVEPGSSEVRMPWVVPFGEGITGRVAAERVPLYVDDVGADPRALSSGWARESGIGHLLSVPILSGDDLLGVLTVRSREDALANAENRALVDSFAARAAVAMQNARTYDEAVRRAARLRDLVAVSRSITASLDARDVMRRIADAAAGMRPGAMAAVDVFDERRMTLNAAAVAGAGWEELPLERPWTAGLPGVVAAERRPVLVPQPAQDPRVLVPEWWERRPKAAYYGIPIEVGDVLVGVLDYILPDGLPDTEEQEALRLLAAQAGVAIRNAQVYQAERAQAGRIRALATVNQRISSALDLDELLRIISESAAEISGVRYVSFWLADEALGRLTAVGGSVPEIAADFPARSFAYEIGLTGWVAWHRTPLVVDDVRGDPRVQHRDWWDRWGLRAFGGYPVMAGEELVAVLAFCHTDAVRFSADTADVIRMFVAQAGVAIQNARLYQEAQRRRDVAEVLARLARDLAGTLDVERVATLVARGTADLLNVRRSMVFRLADDGTLHALAVFGPDADSALGLRLGPGEGVTGHAVLERKMLVVPDALTEPGLVLTPEIRRRFETYGLRSVVAVPLLAGERVVGALVLADALGREFRPDELQTLQAFADQAALAFENARLYASARESLTRLRDTQVQLVQAAKMSALGQLVSGVAHELNNPLSVIIGYGQLLLARDVPAPQRRPIELMVSQGDRMAKIVRNLLFFARQRPPERASVDLQQVLEQTLALRANQLSLSNIAVDTDFAFGLPSITGDGQQLEQVFLNLLLNAEQAILEAGPSGRILLRTRLSDDGSHVMAQVVDDGPGIPADVLPRVFEPFFTTKAVGMGTGLGLSVSYGIVEEHGGRLTVQSRPGETTFTLELPVSPPPAPRSLPLALHRAVTGAGRRALVVEDEEAVLDLVVTILGEAGWQVDVARGGRAAAERLRTHAYDLIVSDMRMPEGDGEELYRTALAHDPALGRRFVFITGDTAATDTWAFLEGSDVTVLEKPFPTAVFQDAVQRVLGRSSADAASSA